MWRIWFQKIKKPRRTGKYLSLSQVRIYYEEFGSGPPLILIHGLSGSGKWWGQNIEFLSRWFHVYVVDLMGFGRSRRQTFVLSDAANSLAEWMEHLNIAHAVVMGHSMGGFIATDLATNHPDKVGKLVLVDAALLMIGRPRLKTGIGLIRALFEMPLRFLPILILDALRAGPRTILNAARQLLTSDIQDRLSNLQIPTLIVWGERDWLVPLEIGEKIHAALHQARFSVIQQAGHNPMWDRPEHFHELLSEFLDELVQEEYEHS